MFKELFAKPHDKRDFEWIETFLKTISGASVKLLTSDPQQGPDGFPYMMISTEEAGEPFLDLVRWCSSKGIGLAINPHKSSPDFVFTYGMTWNFTNRGEFLTAQANNVTAAPIVLLPQQPLFAGKPADTFWPPAARAIFREFLLQQGFMQGRFLLLSEKADGPMDVAFSLESLGNPPEAEWQGILEAFAWFFPSHYSLALLSEISITGSQFYNI